MNFESYYDAFGDIIKGENATIPYNDPHYTNYVKLNLSRLKRWLQTGVINPDLAELIAALKSDQYWTVITEPWCMDAANTLPFIHKLAVLNEHIKVDYQLRDSSPFLIDNYLTNGAKSIPKLIISGYDHQELLTWGPRPAGAKILLAEMNAADIPMDEAKKRLQEWYNTDRGQSFQEELSASFQQIEAHRI